MSKNQIGQIGEDWAVYFLEKKQGMEIISRNWRCKAGEIDIIAKDGPDLVFVEVKTRRDSFTARKYLFDNITAHKQRKLKTLVNLYLAFSDLTDGFVAVRIDVIGVILDAETLKAKNIEHLVSAI